jgi:glycosyltransferase involved in cell wall biosynthesis
MAAVADSRLRDRETVVHLQYCPFSTGPAAIMLAAQVKALGLRLVTTIHEDRWAVRFSKKRIFWRVYPFFEDRLLELSDAIVVHSETQRARMPATARSKARLIEFGIEPCQAPVRALSRRAGPQVGCFGLIAPYKGIDVVVEACALASERVPNLRLVVAGSVPDTAKMRRHLAELQSLVSSRLGERGAVSPDLPDADFDALYHHSDLVCFGLRHVTQSTTFFRSIGHQRPVVTTDVGGVAEVTRREGLGAVVPEDDPAAMAEAIVELLLSKPLQARSRRAARAYASRRTWQANAQEHLALYDEVAA